MKILSALLAATLLSGCSDADGEGQGADQYWDSGQATLQARLAVEPNRGTAKNVILFIGDGMGVSTVTAARIYDGQAGGGQGEENVLSFERFPHVALVKTYNTNQQVPDSAGTASAMHTGVKTKAGVIGVSGEARRGSCADAKAFSVATLGEYAEKAGKATGIVSTARITHATPAALYAHTPERNWESDSDLPQDAIDAGCKDIARQLIDFSAGDGPAGDGLEVALGGGRAKFFGKDKGGKRRAASDDLAAEWSAEPGSVYVDSGSALRDLDLGGVRRLLGLFNDSHMSFAPMGKVAGEPSLPEMTSAAIEILSRNTQGYYLQVEGGRIDHGHHAGIAELALREAREFAGAVELALSKVDLSETLVLVTADHSHVFTLAGYPTRGNPILGLVHGNDASGSPEKSPTLALDGKPYTTLGYQNGPGAVTGERPSPPQGPFHKQQSVVPTFLEDSHGKKRAAETHAGEDVALYAAGPQAYLVGGVMEQHVIFHIIAHAFGWSWAD